MSLRFHPQAREDLFALYDYIAADDVRAAERVIDRLYNACVFLGRNIEAGRARPDLGKALRSFPVSRSVILYRTVGADVEIVYIAHSARDLAALVEQEDR